MNSFEFTTALLGFFGMIGFGLHALGSINSGFSDFHGSLESLLEAEKCAAMVDSFFSNGGGIFEKTPLNCHAIGQEIVSEKNGIEKSAKTISKKNYISNSSDEPAITVEVENHYE